MARRSLNATLPPTRRAKRETAALIGKPKRRPPLAETPRRRVPSLGAAVDDAA